MTAVLHSGTLTLRLLAIRHAPTCTLTLSCSVIFSEFALGTATGIGPGFSGSLLVQVPRLGLARDTDSGGHPARELH
eukprot:2919841-Rhodomonas_salina.3